MILFSYQVIKRKVIREHFEFELICWSLHYKLFKAALENFWGADIGWSGLETQLWHIITLSLFCMLQGKLSLQLLHDQQ